MTEREIKKLKTARVKCDKEPLFFTRYFFKRLRGVKFVKNWHHYDIEEQLERVANYDLEFLNISIAPRHSKTELVLNFIAKKLGENPSSNWLYITASDELRSETSTRIRDIINDEHFKAMYGVELKKDQKAKNLWRTTQGGGLKTATIFGQITGFGAGQMKEIDPDLEEYIRDFEGCIVLDDINKTDDAENLTSTNDKVMRVIGNTIISRKNSYDTPIINIQQRAGIEDATAYFMELYKNNPKAEFLIYPVIYNEKPLWEWKMPMEKIIELKDSPKTSHVFETQYMQNPQPKEGLIFPNLQYYGSINDNEGIKIAYADTADEGTDYFSCIYTKVINNKAYAIDVIHNQYSLDTNKPRLLAFIEEHGIDYMYIETNKDGLGIIRELRKETTSCTLRGRNNHTNKISRIFAQAGFVMNYVFFPEKHENPEYEKFMRQVKRMTHTTKKDDDAPDALAGLANEIRRAHFIAI
jgi:predicted phage terminase large subunit-like protein